MNDKIKLLEQELNAVYAERNQCVAALAFMAIRVGFNAGIKKDLEAEDGWQTVVFIDLPQGQVSWHYHDSEEKLLYGLPEYKAEYDGHTTEEKYRRLNLLC